MKENEPLLAVLTVGEVAALLGIGRGTAYEAVRRGEIPSVRIGKRLIIPRVALAKLLAEAGQKAGAGNEKPNG